MGKIIAILVLAVVLVGGFFLWQKNQKPQKQPVECEECDRQKGELEETANWKTYVNKDGKFSFQYPLNIGAAVQDRDTGVIVVVPGDRPLKEIKQSAYINITFLSLPKTDLRYNLPLKELTEREFRKADLGGETMVLKLEPTTFNGLEGYTYTTRDDIAFGSEFKRIYIRSKSGDDYAFIMISVSDSEGFGYEKITETILSTFKFLDNSAPPNCLRDADCPENYKCSANCNVNGPGGSDCQIIGPPPTCIKRT